MKTDYVIPKEFMEYGIAKVDKVYTYANGHKIHAMTGSCVHEVNGTFTLHIGSANDIFKMERELNTKKPVLAVQKK